MMAWIKLALRRDIFMRGAKTGIVVGSILTLINYGDVLLAGQLSSAMAWKIPLTYLVPYCVATYASVAATKT